MSSNTVGGGSVLGVLHASMNGTTTVTATTNRSSSNCFCEELPSSSSSFESSSSYPTMSNSNSGDDNVGGAVSLASCDDNTKSLFPSSPKRSHVTATAYRSPSMSECDQSIVSASALVGENLLDSPSAARRVTASTRRNDYLFEDDDDDDYDDIVDRDDRADYDSTNQTGVVAPTSESRIRALIDAANNMGVLASGWAWVSKQRARRQRQYLQQQAEEQARKIAQEAEGGSGNSSSHGGGGEATTHNNSLGQNSIFLSLTRKTDESRRAVDNMDGGNEQANMATTERNSLANKNTGVKVTAARISKSGSGVSVSVEIPSDWQVDTTSHDCISGSTASAEMDGVRDSSQDMLDSSSSDWIPQVRIAEDDEKNLLSYPYILTHEQMQEIASSVLPLGISHCLWKRLYSLARDGDSFEACMRLVGNEPRSLLVLRTTRGAIFGGYADSPWEVPHQQLSGFHGTAQACLFTYYGSNNNIGGDKTSPLVVYKWTGSNRYFQLMSNERKMLAFGGGGDEGCFGLCIEQDFQQGSTGCCDTFGNQPLCDQENFMVVDMEIWSFVTGRF